MDWTAVGAYFLQDLPGWIAVLLVLAAAVIGFVRRRRIGEWIRRRLAERAERQRFRTAETTWAIVVDELLSPPDKHLEYMLNRRLGGTFRYQLQNLGPSDAQHVRLRLVGSKMTPMTPLYWERIDAYGHELLEVDIPFAAKHDAVISWAQGKVTFETPKRELPFAKPGGTG